MQSGAIIRLDRFLSTSLLISRSDASAAIKAGHVRVGGELCRLPEQKVSVNETVMLDGEALRFREFVYLMMNKPQGVLSATEDGRGKTVLDLIPEKYASAGLFPAGRLDKDTVGLIILTNDGPLAHRLLSPKHHVAKEYFYRCAEPLTDRAAAEMESGIELDGFTAKPAKVIRDEGGLSGRITLTEGKYHQIKRMFLRVENEITFLERTSFAGIALDASLDRGMWRELTAAEEETLRSH